MNSLLYNRLTAEKTYTRKELLSCLQDGTDTISYNSFSWILMQEIKANRLQHLGRNKYSVNPEFVKNAYTYVLSAMAEKILKRVTSAFPLIGVQIWESRQYNEFLNHQIGINTIFLEVEKMFVESVFEILDSTLKIRVLVQPKIEDFIRYKKENTVIVIRRTSESPVLKNNPYLPSVEKLLVDLKANKYLHSMVNPAEIKDIYSQVYAQYSVSTGTLKRYAMRRTAWEKVEAYLPAEAEPVTGEIII